MSNVFKNFFIRAIVEDVSVGSALGATGGEGDFYAPGDARMPHALGAKKVKAKKKKKVKETLRIPIQRRVPPGM